MISIERKHIYLITLLGIIVFFYKLGHTDLWGDQVARSAWMTREMVQRGEWIVPQVNGKPNYEKPILWIWVLMLFSLPLGVNEFSVRLPSALAALGSAYAVYALGRRLAGARCGFRAALISMTAVKVMHMATVPRIDMSLTLLVSLVFVFFLRGYQDDARRRSSYLWAAVFTALGFLDKGPVAVIIPAGGIFLFLFVARGLRQFAPLLSPRNIIVFLSITAPWYIAVDIKTHGEFTRRFFLYYNVTVYSGYSYTHPFWYSVSQLLTGFFPWSVFLPFAVAGAFAARRGNPALLPLAWFLCVFVFFSLSVYKRGDYLLPLYPAAALLTALFLKSVEEGASGWRLAVSRLAVGILIVATVAALAAAVLLSPPGAAERIISSGFVQEHSSQKDRDTMRLYARIVQEERVFLVVFLCAVGVFLVRALRRMGAGGVDAAGLIAGIAAVMTIFNTQYLRSFLPELDREMSLKAYSRFLAQRISPLDRFALYDTWFYEFGYYMQRDVGELQVPGELREYFSQPGAGYCLVDTERLDEALAVIGDLPHRLEPSLDGPKGRLTMIARPAGPQAVAASP
jgi:hypothetical protein